MAPQNSGDWASMRFPPMANDDRPSSQHRNNKLIRLLKVNGLELFLPVAASSEGNGTDVAADTGTSCRDEKTVNLILDCTLEVFGLSEGLRPEYEAVSYTWGMLHKEPGSSDDDAGGRAQKARCRIRINGHETPLAINLYDLFDLHWRRLQGKHIWIDQICIDQDNKEEKTKQVRLMSEIYRLSKKVIIWLGRDEKDLEEFSDVQQTMSRFILRLIEHQKARWKQLGGSEDNFDGRFILSLNYHQFLQKYGYGLGPTPAQWKSWSNFFKRRWFSRVWTVEEHRLANQFGKVFLCGEREINCLPLIGTLYYVLRSPSCRRAVIASVEERDHLETVYQFLNLDQHHAHRAHLEGVDNYNKPGLIAPDTLLTMMSVTRSLGCTNPRDRIYGIAALEGTGGGYRFAGKAFEPDYSLTVEEVAFGVTSYLVTILPNLDVLSLVNNSSRDKSTDQSPSWMLDLRYQAKKFEWSLADTWFSSSPIYNACISDPDVPPDRKISGKRLICKGGRIGTVVHAVKIEGHLTSNFEHLQQLLGMSLCIPIFQKGGEHRLEVLWRTLIGDFGGEQYHPPAYLAVGFGLLVADLLTEKKAFLRSMFDELLEPKAKAEARLLDDILRSLNHPTYTGIELPCISRARRPLGRMDLMAPEIMLTKGEELYNSMTEYIELLKCDDKAVIWSSSGVLGLAPLHTQQNDEIWLLQNARTPFILRPAGTDASGALYTLVGEAFVYGAMQGEYMVPAMTTVFDHIGVGSPSLSLFNSVVWENHYDFYKAWESVILV